VEKKVVVIMGVEIVHMVGVTGILVQESQDMGDVVGGCKAVGVCHGMGGSNLGKTSANVI